MFKLKKEVFSGPDRSRIIEMAWADEIPFKEIENQYKLSPSNVIKFMRANLKRSSFIMWRKRTFGNKMKSLVKRKELFEV